MKFGSVEITLFHPEDDSLYEERVVEGKNYFVAEIGREFKVRVTLNNDKRHPKAGHLRVRMSIDGECVDGQVITFKELREEERETLEFHGFPKSNSYNAIEFKKESFTYNAQQPDSKIGTILLSFQSCKRFGRPSKKRVKSEDKEETNFKLQQKKALWNQPSARTAAGRAIGACGFEGVSYYFYEPNGKYEEEITVPYHTAAVLDQWKNALINGTANAMTSSQSFPLAASTQNDAGIDDDEFLFIPKKPKVLEVIDLRGQRL